MDDYEDRSPNGPTSGKLQTLEAQSSSKQQELSANHEMIRNYARQVNFSGASELSLIEPLSFGSVPSAQQPHYSGTSGSTFTETPSYGYAHGLSSFGSSYTLRGQQPSATFVNHQCSQSDIFSPTTRSVLSRNISTIQNDPNRPPGKGESSGVVWSKDVLTALSAVQPLQPNPIPIHLDSPAPQTILGSVDTENGNQKKSNSFQTGTHAITSKMKIPRYVFHPNEALRLPQKLANTSGSFLSERPLSCDTPQRSEASENSNCVSRPDLQPDVANDQRFQEFQDALRWNENYAALCLKQMARSLNKNTPFNNTPLHYVPTSRNQEQEHADNNSSQVVSCNLHQHFPVSNGYRQAFLPSADYCNARALAGTCSNGTYTGSLSDFTFQRASQSVNIPHNTMDAQFTSSTSTAIQSPVGATTQFTPYPISMPFTAPFSPFFEATIMGQQFSPHQGCASGNTRDSSNDKTMFHSPLATAVQPKPAPVGYAFDSVPLLHFPRELGYQATMPYNPRVFSILQYPDPRAMFREANLLRLDYANEGSASLVHESLQRTPQPPSLQEENSLNQDEIAPQKQTTSTSVPVKRTPQTNQCKICSKICARASSLKVHMRTHTGEKPFSCKFCKRTFAQTGGLKSHVRTHTGEKPYKCDICDRCFSHSTAVANHKRTHTGEKPYVCNHVGCGKSFADQSTLKKHHRTHTGEKPFDCPYCTKKFTQLGNMNKHLKCKHSEKNKQ